MNRHARRWRNRTRWVSLTVTILIPVTPTILEPIAPGCVEYGPACVIDLVGNEPTPETVVTVEYPDPFTHP